MALSTLIGRRLWCSIVSNAHAVPKNASLFRRLPRNVIQIRGLWLSPLRRPYPLHNKNINVRFLATHNNGRRNKRGDTDPETSTKKTGTNKWGLGSVAVGASFMFGKAKYVLAAVKLAKFAPLASMLVSSFAYSFFYGWPFAIGMVGLIAVHESGHALAMRYYGVPFSPMVFIPFMGAVISMKDQPKNVLDEAVIALAGPLVGSAGAGLLAVSGAMTGSQLCMALADFGFMINLFNLLPIGSMDGGRISSALSPWLNVAGVGVGGAMIYSGMVHNPIFYLIMMGGVYTSASRFLEWEGQPHPSYYRIPNQDKWKLGLAYGALIAALLWAMQQNNGDRKTYRQLQMEAEGQDSSSAAADVGVEQHGVKYDDFSQEMQRGAEQIFGSSFSLGDDESWQSEQSTPESESWQSEPESWQSEPEWQQQQQQQQQAQRYDEHDARTLDQDNWRTK